MTGTSAQTARNEMTAQGTSATDPRKRGRGQVIVIFAGALLLLMMMTALVVDVSWYWVNSLRVQRAADAAALAGAVMLPNKVSDAYTLAREEAKKNGYPIGGGVSVTPLQDPDNDRRLNVTIHAPIGTFFMRVLGIDSIGVTRTSKAEFTLARPDGQPAELLRRRVLRGPGIHHDEHPRQHGLAACGHRGRRRPVEHPGPRVLEQQPVRDRGHEQRSPAVVVQQPPGAHPEQRHAGHRWAGSPSDRHRPHRHRRRHELQAGRRDVLERRHQLVGQCPDPPVVGRREP